MSDALLSALMPALDLYVIERRADSSFAAVAPRPDWLMPALGLGGDSPFALAQVFPFLDGFLRDAEAFWRGRTGPRLTSGEFTAGSGEGEVLLRASALNVGLRSVLVLERLHGAADPRPLLQTARENKLEYERLAREASARQHSLAAVSSLAARLLETDLTSPQRELAEGIAAAARASGAGDREPPGPARPGS